MFESSLDEQRAIMIYKMKQRENIFSSPQTSGLTWVHLEMTVWQLASNLLDQELE